MALNDDDNIDLTRGLIYSHNDLEQGNFQDAPSNEPHRDSDPVLEDTSHDEEISLLFEMGFALPMITKVYIFLHPVNLEEAIRFMTQENGIYQHNFFQRHNSISNQCYICGERREIHMDFDEDRHSPIPDILELINRFGRENERNFNDNQDNLRNSRQNRLRISDNNNLLSNPYESKECLVCYSELTEEEKENNKLSCNHIYCDGCWIEYLKDKITSSNVSKINCMGVKCKAEVSEEFIMKKIDGDQTLIDKYYKFKEASKIIDDPNKKFCPYPNCDSFLLKDPNTKYVQCQKGHQFCFNCTKKWHGDTPCDEEIDKDFQMWKKSKVIKRCPKCQLYTEKNKGCNHMTCVKCKYQWCWLCEKEYRPGHFNSGTCEGLQFANVSKPPTRNCCFYFKRKMARFGLFLLELFCCWLFFVPAATITTFVVKIDDSSHKSVAAWILMALAGLALGVAYEIFISSLLILLVIPICFHPPLLDWCVDFVGRQIGV
ncbi:MAG: E3 ubiquitin protein ligase [archaeon]|nr:E3 ubiquitin protein ligase [archaeon]